MKSLGVKLQRLNRKPYHAVFTVCCKIFPMITLPLPGFHLEISLGGGGEAHGSCGRKTAARGGCRRGMCPFLRGAIIEAIIGGYYR